MIITRTPLRVSFVGGGTDLASFYRRSPGAVVSMAVNKYFYLSMHPHFAQKGFLLKYSETENPETADRIKHRIIRAVFERYGVENADFSSAADVPGGTGMGSSSSFTVSLLQLVHASQHRYVSQRDLAREACEIEIDVLGEPIGKQDQYGGAVGGLKFIQFNTDDSVEVTPVHLRQDERRKLEGSLMLFYLGNQRSASAILEKQNKATATEEQVFKSLEQMAAQAHQFKSDIATDVDCIGHYLREGWELKKSLSSAISNPLIDGAYAAALDRGALGGKLLGAGAGGFLMVYCPQDRQEGVSQALGDFPLHRLKIDNSGSTVIFAAR
jgi:D-glycero-alpha-D-manno-heptose-7-phosphate kinase